MLHTAQPPAANPRSGLRPVPGLAASRRRGLLEASQAMQRCPRVHDGVSSCRLGTGATESAGTRDGTAGTQSGQAYLQGAFADAAVLGLRGQPAGQPSRARVAQKPRQGPAWPGLAHP